jgi:protein-disulfide isomerase
LPYSRFQDSDFAPRGFAKLEDHAVITRRGFLLGASALAIGAAATARWPLPALQWMTAAAAQAPSTEELMKPGPLSEQAMGDPKAPVTIIEYASMTCSHCAHFATTTFPVLKARYIDTGKVRYILREFPLDPLAAGAFMLARCAGDDKYFPLVEKLFAEQKNWAFVQNPIQPLFAVAKTAGFTEQSFEKCLSDQKLLDNIDETRQRAQQKFGVNSTPTFFINGKIIRGAVTIEELEKELQPFLKS